MAGPTGAQGVPLTADDLYEVLESKIVNGEFEAGTRLPSERQVASEYGLSRPGVREVLRRLEERKLIVVHPGRGSFVLEVAPTSGRASVDQLVRRGGVTARDLVVARSALEAESAALAAEHHSPGDAARLHGILEAFEAADDDIVSSAALDLAFHEALVIASGNEVLQMMFGSIRELCHAMMLRSVGDRQARNVAAPYHHDILAAVEARDPEAARAAMRNHLLIALDYYGYDIDLPLARILTLRAQSHPDFAKTLHRVGLSRVLD